MRVTAASKTGIVVVHHIDDGRCAGNAASLNKLLDEDLAAHCEITTGPLEAEGVSVEVLGKTKTRLPGCILTAPDPKHAENIIKALGLKPGEKSPVPSRKPDLSDTTPLEAGDAAGTVQLLARGFISQPTAAIFNMR